VIRSHELVFFGSTEELAIRGTEPVTAKVDPRSRDSKPADVELISPGGTVRLPRFAEWSVHGVGRDHRLSMLPSILWVESFDATREVALIGQYRTVLYDPVPPSSRECLDLYRSESSYDAGFSRCEILPEAGGMILVYESGAARVGADGNPVWHHRLFVNDIYERRDADFLYYWSEDDGVSTISITDGRREVVRSTDLPPTRLE
jgi:hypothetical protein